MNEQNINVNNLKINIKQKKSICNICNFRNIDLNFRTQIPYIPHRGR